MDSSSKECGVCLGNFSKDSKAYEFETLVCGHSICKDCYKNIINITKNNKCPFCREPFHPVKTIQPLSSITESEQIDEFNVDAELNIQNLRRDRERIRQRRVKNNRRRKRGCFRRYILPDILEEFYLFSL